MASLISKASLLMVPSVYEDGTLYNVLPSGNKAPDETGNHNGYDQTRADFTFSRGSNLAATRVNSDGLIEKGRENLFTQSNNFSHSDWNVKAGTFTQGVADPDGGNNAWAWEATNTDPYLYQSGKSINGIGTLSIWVKGVGSTIGKTFELRNASFPYKNITLTGEWQRVEHFNNTASGTSVGFEFGNPAVVGDVVHIYQAQYEYGLVATSYMDSGATTATAGVLENTPRIDYSSGAGALLLEPQRTNLIVNSEYANSTNWGNGGTTYSNNEATSPDGGVNAIKLSEDNSTAFHYLGSDISGVSTADTYSISGFIKKGSRRYGGLRAVTNGFVNRYFVLLDLEDGSVVDTHTQGSGVTWSYNVEDYGSGWYRIEISGAHTSGTIGGTFSPSDTDSPTYFGALPDYNGVTGENIYCYGLQAERGSHASSYVPTHGAAVTRGADTMPYNEVPVTSSAWTAYFELDLEQTELASNIQKMALKHSDNSTVYQTWRLFTRSAQYHCFVPYFNADAEYPFSTNTDNNRTDNGKIVMSANGFGTFKLFTRFNGTTTTQTVTGKSNFIAKYYQMNVDAHKMGVSKVMFFDEALSDSECQSLVE